MDPQCSSSDSFMELYDNGTVSNGMISCLNLTGIERYVAAYCTNPPKDDDCPFDFCPNPEIAGPLVRIANYVTSFCVAVLIFYSPRRVHEAFWSQILTIYSLLLTCLVSTARGDLTRFHALVILALVLSPITIYFIAYSIRSFWSSKHRLDHLLGPSHWLQRFFVLLAGASWLGIFIYTYLPEGSKHFAQASCKGRSVMEVFFLVTPFVSLKVFNGDGIAYSVRVVLFTVPFIVMSVAWIIAILRRREEIWPPGEPYRPRFVKVWRTIGYYYPLIQFTSVVMFPMGYWVLVVEFATLGTQDNKFSLSFGQVFALFVAVPPLLQATQLLGKVWYWFRGVSWVRRVAGPPPGRRKNEKRDSYSRLLGE